MLQQLTSLDPKGFGPGLRGERYMFRLHLENEPSIVDLVSKRDISWALDQIIGEVRTVLRRVSPEEAESFIQELEKANRIFCFGAGRSGFVLRTFCMRLMQLGFTVYYVGETITPRNSTGRSARRHLGFRRDRSYLRLGETGVQPSGSHRRPHGPPGFGHRSPGRPEPGRSGHHQTDVSQRRGLAPVPGQSF